LATTAGLLAAALEVVDVFPDALDAEDDAVAAGFGAAAGSSFFGSPSPGFPGPMNVLTLSQNPTAIPRQETIFIF
jgi:hypothetical protein